MLPKTSTLREPPPVCSCCGTVVHPLVARYLFVNMGWRGRPSLKPDSTRGFCLCGPCADQVLHVVRPFMPGVPVWEGPK